MARRVGFGTDELKTANEASPGGIREVAIYFALAYGFSALLWLPVMLGKNRSFAAMALGTFGPTLAAFATQRIVAGNWRAVQWWSSFPRFILGFLASGSIFLFTDFLFALVITRSGFSRWRWAVLMQIVTLFPINLLGGPLGEEAGWRGFALSRIQRRMNPVLSAIVVGFFWAIWHFPLILAHVYNVSWWQFLLMTVSASILISFGFNVSRGSTICAVFLHGLYNVAIGVIGNDFVGKATLHSQSFQNHALWMGYVGVAGLLCLLTRGRLGYRGSLAHSD